MKNTFLLKEKEDLLKEVDSRKALQPATPTRGNSSLERMTQAQPSTPTSQSCHACRKLGHIFVMYKVNKLIANSVRRWVPKEELDNAKREKSTCPRVIVFKRLGPKFVTKDHNKTL